MGCMVVMKTKDGLKHSHDLVFRSVLVAPDVLADLLRNYLPREQVARLDLNYIICESPVSVDEDLDERRGDLFFVTRFRDTGELLRVFLFVEHQSTPERFFVVRAIEYICKAYRQYLSSNEANGKDGKPKLLPYPIVMVVYNGKKPWGEVRPIRDLITSVPGVDVDILQLPICLIDLPRIPPEQLKGNGIVRALLDSMKSASSGTLDERYEEIISHLKDVKKDPRVGAWAKTLTLYALEQTGLKGGMETIRRAYRNIFTKKEADKMAMTTAEELRLQGKAEGKTEGKAEMIMVILSDRFGQIPTSLEKKITAVRDSARLSDLGKLAASCKALSEFKKAL